LIQVRFDFSFALESIPRIITGLPMTLIITVVSMAAGLLIGFFVALCRIHKIPFLRQLSALYVSFIRGTPLIVQLYLTFYTLPALMALYSRYSGGGDTLIIIPPLTVALICYTLNTAAYLSNAIGAALSSVEISQMEAAYSVGESYWQGLRRIILPQALIIAFPTLTNSLLNLLKGTSFAYTVMVVDLMARAKIVAAEGYRYLESFVVCAVIYWLLCFTIEKICVRKGDSLSGKGQA
jgi:L-cystine transport system permease protein